MSLSKNLQEINESGLTLIKNYFDESYLDQIVKSIDMSYILCREVQVKNGVQEVTDGTVHHLLATGDLIYLDLLKKISESNLYTFLESFFKGKFILNGYGGVINLPNNPSYVANIHRDIRFFSDGFPLMLNLLVMLDDFTVENGGTYFLGGSHRHARKPSSEDFYRHARQAVGNKGDIIFFDSNLWHAAGVNRTSEKRRALTITFTKPFMKQQLDYSRALGYEKVESMDDNLKQILGYFSRTPTNLSEWYQKPGNRFYRPGQD